MIIKEQLGRWMHDMLYQEEMTEALMASRPLPKQLKPITEAEILAMQPASTRRTLERDPALDETHWNRAVLGAMITPVNELIKNPSAIYGSVGTRQITTEEYLTYIKTRSNKNQLGDSDCSATTSQSRTRAVEAFVFSKPAELTPAEVAKVTKITPIVSTPLEPVQNENEKHKWYWPFGVKNIKDGMK